MEIRPATPAESLAVRRLLDAALLEYDDLEAAIETGDVLVAISDAGPDRDGGSIIGTIVLEPRDRGAAIRAIAVRRRRRGQGVGTALIEHALEQRGRLSARFDARVGPFYDALGFEIEACPPADPDTGDAANESGSSESPATDERTTRYEGVRVRARDRATYSSPCEE